MKVPKKNTDTSLKNGNSESPKDVSGILPPDSSLSALNSSSMPNRSIPLNQASGRDGGDDDNSGSSSDSDNGSGDNSAPPAARSPASDNRVDESDDEDDGERPTMQAIVAFLCPVLSPYEAVASWGTTDIRPWDGEKLRRLHFTTITVDEIRSIFPRSVASGWIHPAKPRRGVPIPAYNENLLTDIQVRTLYREEPWLELETLPVPLTFASGDADFITLIRLFKFHLRKWCQVYWEGTHTFPFGEEPSNYLLDPQSDMTVRRSRAKFNFKQTVLPEVVRLMRHGRCDIDILLDPIFPIFPPSRNRTKWFPVGTVDTLSDGSADPETLLRSLRAVDCAEPWRLFFRHSPDDHPAQRLPRLKNKFIQVAE
ncbi:hypothetical protein KRP22_004639 [Phytophthora ramorum]|nr:hypothetical protein KRP22_10270 [Phytophthora ramorum]